MCLPIPGVVVRWTSADACGGRRLRSMCLLWQWICRTLSWSDSLWRTHIAYKSACRMYFYTFSVMMMMFGVDGVMLVLRNSDMVEYRGLSVKFHVHILDHRPLCYSDNTLIAWGAFNDIPQILSAIRSVCRSLTAKVSDARWPLLIRSRKRFRERIAVISHEIIANRYRRVSRHIISHSRLSWLEFFVVDDWYVWFWTNNYWHILFCLARSLID